MPHLIKKPPAQEERDTLAAFRLGLLQHRGPSIRDLIESSKQAIEESRALLKRIAKDHPDVD